MKRAKAANWILLTVSLVVYFINTYMRKHQLLTNHLFLKNHFNDCLAMIVVMSIYCLIFYKSQTYTITKPYTVIRMCFLASIMWEYIAPLVNKNSVSDYVDCICYFLGGFIYCLLMQLFLNSDKKG